MSLTGLSITFTSVKRLKYEEGAPQQRGVKMCWPAGIFAVNLINSTTFI